MADLTVVAANLHNARRAARWLNRRSRPDHRDTFDVALVSEAQKRRHALRMAPAHRYHTGPPGMGDNDAGRETGILVGHNLPDLGTASERVSTAYPKAPRVGKERWAQTSLIERGGVTIALLAFHPVAAPEALRVDDEAHALVKRHKEFTDWLHAALVYHRSLGREAVCGGDVNVRQHWAGADDLRAVLRAHSLDGIWDGLDGLWATPGLRIVDREAHRNIGSDHPALRIGVNVRRRR